MAVNVSGYDDRELRREVPGSDHIGGTPEHVVRGPDPGSFDAVVYAEDADIRVDLVPVRCRDQAGEPIPYAPSYEGKAGDSHPLAPDVDGHRARPIEDVKARMPGTTHMWDPRAFVIPGHHEHGSAFPRDAMQGAERLVDQRGDRPGSMEYVSPVDEKVDVPLQGALGHSIVVGLEIVPPSTASDAGTNGEIEAEMAVGE